MLSDKKENKAQRKCARKHLECVALLYSWEMEVYIPCLPLLCNLQFMAPSYNIGELRCM